MAKNSASPEQEFLSSIQSAYSDRSASGATVSSYDTARAEFQTSILGPVLGSEGSAGNREIVETSPSGKVLYANGAIYDPETRQTLYPTDHAVAAGIPGSDAWLREQQTKGDEWAEKWRKKLWEQGYQGGSFLQSESGGWGVDLVEALRAYHGNRYANYGKPLPLSPAGDVGAREALRKQTDFVALKQEIKGWGHTVFGEELDDATSDWLADKMMRTMTKLATKHPEWSFAQIQEGANIRTQKVFTEMPGVKQEIRDMEEEELDDSLRQSIVSVAQLGNI